MTSEGKVEEDTMNTKKCQKKVAEQETYKENRKKGVKEGDDIENPHTSSQHQITAHQADRLVNG